MHPASEYHIFLLFVENADAVPVRRPGAVAFLLDIARSHAVQARGSIRIEEPRAQRYAQARVVDQVVEVRRVSDEEARYRKAAGDPCDVLARIRPSEKTPS